MKKAVRKRSEQKRYVIYSRKSRFTGKGESIENQIELCRQYITAHYGEDAAKNVLVYEDEGFSGGTLDRPQFKKMMADSQTMTFAAIVVYRLDRISRNIGDFANLIEDLNNRGIDFISIREQFDTGSPMGRAMMYIASVFSQLERETIAERIRDNMLELAKTGRWLGGTTPTGFRSASVTSVTIDGRTRRAHMLERIDDECRLVELIFSKFTELRSLTLLEAFLLKNFYKTKNGRNFTRFALRNILTNPVYAIADKDTYRYFSDHGCIVTSECAAFDGECGIMPYNRTDQRTGSRHNSHPMEEWIIAVGKHRGLIAGSRWIMVQEILEQNRSRSYRKPRGHRALLSGVLVCGQCGAFMRPKASSYRYGEPGNTFSYRCSLKERSKGSRCCSPNVNGTILDEMVIGHLAQMSSSPIALIGRLNDGLKLLSGKGDDTDSEIRQLNARIRGCESEIRNLVSALGRDPNPSAADYLLEQMDELRRKIEVWKERLKSLGEAKTRSGIIDPEFGALLRRISSVRDMFDDMNVEEKRLAIKACIRQIVWDGKCVHILFFGSSEDFGFPVPENNTGDEGNAEPLSMGSK
ncbi:MAG: recombinase family protein [Oscillospiraceae bacterium]|nr:recombinase family protein [Oscillospiraceae bacterium]